MDDSEQDTTLPRMDLGKEVVQPMRINSCRTGFAVAVTACASPALAGSGNLPGTGPVITGAQITATPSGVTISGDTSDNTDDFDVGPLTNPPTDCGPSTAPDAWYTISIGAATGTLPIDIDLCASGTLYDAKIFVLDAATNPIACNDETGCAIGVGPPAIAVTLIPGVYELAIDGFSSEAGPYAGQIRIFAPPSCFLDPPCTGTPEGEPCDEVNPDTFNSGCNTTPEAFSEAVVNGTMCGVNWGNGGSRDTDWWRFSVSATPSLVRVAVRAETDTAAFIAQLTDGGTCPVVGIPDGPVAYSGSCNNEQILGEFYSLDAGDYIVFVGVATPFGGGIFDGFPCPGGGSGTNNAYELELDDFGCELCSPCPWDLNMNQSVDFADILQIIANWGPCPTKPDP